MRLVLAFVSLVALAPPAYAQGTPTAPPPTLVASVRQAIADKDFARGERLIAADVAASGVTPQNLAARSWLGRGALAEKRLDAAEGYAEATYRDAAAAGWRKGRWIATRMRRCRLPSARRLKSWRYVQVERGARSEAVGFLRREVARYKGHVRRDAHSEEPEPVQHGRHCRPAARPEGVSRGRAAAAVLLQGQGGPAVLLGPLVRRLQTAGSDPRCARGARTGKTV